MSTQLTSSAPRPRVLWELPAVVFLLLLHVWLGLSATVDMACTADELPHLASGHAYWTHHAYQMHPENGILPQRWASLPAFLEGVRPPDPTHPAWRKSDIWSVGFEYLYQNPDIAPELALLQARAIACAWPFALGLLVYFWSRRLFGRGGAFLSLLLYCFCPALLANGPLVTSDACAAFFLLAAIAAFWRHLHTCSIGSLLLSALTFGLCCVAKFNAALLLPLFVLLLAISALRHYRSGSAVALWTAPARHLLLGLAAHVGLAVLIIWAFYGFGLGEAPSFDSYHFTWAELEAGLGWKARLLAWIRDHHILPANYVHGFATVLEMSQQRGAFLNGEVSLTGWPEFFPCAFLFKSTLTLLLACCVLVFVKLPARLQALRTRGLAALLEGTTYACMPLLTFWCLFWLSSVTLRLNIGHRHILPMYPLLYILLGALGAWLLAHRLRWVRPLALVLVLGQALECSLISPHYLAHFNVLAGGPAAGHTHLVDSSLDWGQDLPGLQLWLDQDPQARSHAPVRLAYFGVASIPHHVPRAGILLNIMANRLPGDLVDAVPGIYCIGATMLEQSYLHPREWTLEHERRYQFLRPYADRLLHGPGGPSKVDRMGTPEAYRFWRDFEELRFRRLAAFLRARQPDATIGYSILIYRLSEADLQAALRGTWTDWVNGMSRQVRLN